MNVQRILKIFVKEVAHDSTWRGSQTRKRVQVIILNERYDCQAWLYHSYPRTYQQEVLKVLSRT